MGDMRPLCRSFALLLFIGFQAPITLLADYVMGPPEVNQSLKSIAQIQKLLKASLPDKERAEAIYRLAKEAEDLTFLINLEIRSHGFEQKQLIDLAVQRCGKLEVSIRYDSKKNRYLYDRGAFASYLKLAPEGPKAREARFMTIERTFYNQKTPDGPEMQNLIGDIKEFLAAYPQFEKTSELELYLAISYRDLYRLYAEAGSDGALAAKNEAERICEKIIRNYPEEPEAKIAENMLKAIRSSQ